MCNSVQIKSLLLLLLCFGRALTYSTSPPTRSKDVPNRPAELRSSQSALRRIQADLIALNNSDSLRDKRALGLVLRGFMEALGYTVSPIQVGALADPVPSAAAPAIGRMGPMAPAGPGVNSTKVGPSARQRETIRFTGFVNFGNNSNLLGQLQRYEQLFHGNATTPSAPAAASQIDPRSRPPLLEPLFVKIPLPIAPNLPPPLPPSPMAVVNDPPAVGDDYESSENEEESEDENPGDDKDNYEESEEEEDEQGETEDADRNERKKEYDSSDNKKINDPKDSDRSVEREYKKKENREKYTVENKEIYHPSEVAQDKPTTSRGQDESNYTDDSQWRKRHEDRLRELERVEEEKAEKLIEENDRREEDDDREYRSNRGEEIGQQNQKHSARFEEQEEESDYDGSSAVASREEPQRNGNVNKELDTNKSAKQEKEVHDGDGDEEEDETINAKFPVKKNYDGDDNDEENEREYYAGLPISYGHEKLLQDEELRDSYGESLEKPGAVDERLISYFTMFKNPRTGIYDPRRIENMAALRTEDREILKSPYFDSRDDTLSNYEKSISELSDDKFESYKPEEDKHSKKTHSWGEDKERDSVLGSQRTSEDQDARNGKEEERFKARKSSKNVLPSKSNCNCNSNKADGEVEEARHDKPASVTGLDKQLKNDNSRSTTKKLYKPYEPYVFDPRIIDRLTSYDDSKTFNENENSVRKKPSRVIVRKKNDREQSKILPSEVALPERIMLKSLHEGEGKEFHAWPAPFDYVFDSTEESAIILPGTTQSFSETSSENRYRQLKLKDPSNHAKQIFEESRREYGTIDPRNSRKSEKNDDTYQGRRKNYRAYRKANENRKTSQESPERKRSGSVLPVNIQIKKRSQHNSVPNKPVGPLNISLRNPLPKQNQKDYKRTVNFGINDQEPPTAGSILKSEIYSSGQETKTIGFTNGYPDVPRVTIIGESSHVIEKTDLPIIIESTPYPYNEKVTYRPITDREILRFKEYGTRMLGRKRLLTDQ